MKELSTKEKAEAYDKALDRAKKWYNAPNIDKIPTYGNRIIEEIFPELKESEDERIRKRLIFDFKVIGKTEWGGLEVKDILAWLEKQGNPTEINPSEFDLRINKLLKQFETLPKEELASSLSFYLNVVQNDGTYREEKQGEQNLNMAKSPQLGEQKSAWSEEDSPYYDDICEILRNLILIETDKINKDFVQKDLDWLKSLKDRYSWKPSEKQMKALKEACDEHWEPDGLDPLYTLYQDLKKLREE